MSIDRTTDAFRLHMAFDVRLSPSGNMKHMVRNTAKWSTRRDSRKPFPEFSDLSEVRAAGWIDHFIHSVSAASGFGRVTDFVLHSS